ncbi:uncharacterized protein FOMMEDRAFT_73613 [Fomitiporia mediterranea MF3/22]|uniref:uncharacterized protein n=1 Tax=Fomitiporia mediterranea (strain MF3/22) TaxID=694068 RepID=UPI00044090B3|nr:uncharacterized protein FOMMEDRAFT_73613 [Fomitiporia mediterranea MF3/22]EJD07684.1 hypothetical protein FOMMEDRAFT_73613 [Fomitiporia mediterranea MF3/22]
MYGELNAILHRPQLKSEPTETTNTSSDESLIQNNVEQAKRAVALRKYEQAVEFYATALELTVKKYGDESPEAADLYFIYGKALLENAISQTAVLGKEQAEEALLKDEDAEGGASGANPFISFSGDAEEEEEEDTGGEDTAVDLFAEANAAVEAEEKENAEEAQDGDDEDGEPEDDFNAAWECLDLARALFEKRKDEDDTVKLKLADTYIALGDVSLETEKFELAIPDYEAGLALKTSLLPTSSRQIAEAHYKLSMVLDLTSGRLAQAISHAEKALESVESRLAEMRTGLSGQLPPLPEPPKANAAVDVKGKGKAVAAPSLLAQEELVQNMSKSQIEKEIKELEGLREDLGLKVEELKTNPGSGGLTNAPELAAKALDLELNSSTTTVKAESSQSAVVNDLNQMVRKKKKTAQPNGDAEMNGKRKAEESEGEVPAESKKAKVEDAPASP